MSFLCGTICLWLSVSVDLRTHSQFEDINLSNKLYLSFRANKPLKGKFMCQNSPRVKGGMHKYLPSNNRRSISNKMAAKERNKRRNLKMSH